MMGLKDLFGTTNNKEPKRCTINNVMEYLRSEGFQPTRDSYDNPVISFKYQGENLAICIIDDFCRIFGIWEVKRDEMLPEAMYAASMYVMDRYRYIRVVYYDDRIILGVDHTITTMEQFAEFFGLATAVIGACHTDLSNEYHRLVQDANEGTDSENDESRRRDIYQPEFRWMPDVLLDAVQTKQLVPEALTDEEWLRQNIQERTSSAAMAKEWESFKINRVENYGDYKLIVYQFPEPKVVPEAKYGAVLLNTNSLELNYYTLEMSFDNKWVYGSMTSERHSNYGSFDTPDLEKFIEWIFSKDKNFEGGVDYTKQQQIN